MRTVAFQKSVGNWKLDVFCCFICSKLLNSSLFKCSKETERGRRVELYGSDVSMQNKRLCFPHNTINNKKNGNTFAVRMTDRCKEEAEETKYITTDSVLIVL